MKIRRIFYENNGYWMRTGWVFAIFAACILGFIGLVGVGVYYAGRSSCNAFEEQTGRETRFGHLTVAVGVPLTWDCFARTADGRWISTSQLRTQEDS